MFFAIGVELITCVSGKCRLATQVALLGNVPEPFESVKGLVKWQEAHRRKLLQSEHMVQRPASLLLCHAESEQLYHFHGSYQTPSIALTAHVNHVDVHIRLDCACYHMLTNLMLVFCCRLPFQYFDQPTMVRKGDRSHVISGAASWCAGWCTVPNTYELQARHTLVWISQVRLKGVMTAFGFACWLA